jgi:hypothetical protein
VRSDFDYGTLYGTPGILKSEKNGKCLKRMVSAEGIESALKQQRKNLLEHSWQFKAL